MKKIILYSNTFKGYLRVYQKKSGGQVFGLELKFDQDKQNATQFETRKDKEHFLENYCIGVNYDFREEEI